ncbi:Dps family protein [Paenibacillus arenosi]|uniref:DNA starvation/stationary phase protection protein n=1 Tax=Paenibacillus arenosi TaxID=2774142 RepID=A0ABR9B199_9BACL|nr:Dps family protein [Paenibacillus arenosi]MBD8500161.1 DNA starvation/stationary phase protection protein [Paenibacillus arenosi]
MTNVAVKQDIKSLLNQQVANLNVLYVKLHSYHWFVKGPMFFQLHEKFEELYNEITLKMDDVAERLLTIGGKPHSTLKQYVEHTTLQEAAGNENAEQMVKQLVADLKQLVSEFEQAMEAAEEANDEATGDVFLGMKADFEKHIWMFEAYLG